MECVDLDECNISKERNKSFTDFLNLVQSRITSDAKSEI